MKFHGEKVQTGGIVGFGAYNNWISARQLVGTTRTLLSSHPRIYILSPALAAANALWGNPRRSRWRTSGGCLKQPVVREISWRTTITRKVSSTTSSTAPSMARSSCGRARPIPWSPGKMEFTSIVLSPPLTAVEQRTSAICHPGTATTMRQALHCGGGVGASPLDHHSTGRQLADLR